MSYFINSENCWGKNYDPDNPNPLDKVYRDKCCIACQPGEYLNQNTNSCDNCKAGHACPSTLRKISQTMNKESLI